MARAVTRRGARPQGARRLALGGAAVVAAVVLAAALLLVHLHRQAREDAQRELANLALVLARYTENNLQSVDLLQDSLIDMVLALDIRSVEQFNELLATNAVDQNLRARIAALPQINVLSFTNADGVTVASTQEWPPSLFSIADQPQFQVLRDNPEQASYLGPPVLDTRSGVRDISITRRIGSADGRFLGVVSVGFGLAGLETFLSRIALGPGSAIAIWRRDGLMLARYPQPAATGREPTWYDNGPCIRGLTWADHGLCRSISRIDGQDRFIAIRALTDYPMTVTVSRLASGVLAPWWRQAGYIAGAVLLITAVVLGGILLGIRQLRSRELLESARTAMRVLHEQRRGEARIAHLAQHDPLTGLANRTLMRMKLEEAVALARAGGGCTVMCVDLDQFKDVNDTLGHPVGDLLLQAVAQRLRSAVRETDTIARLGGDEFAIVQAGPRQAHDAETLARRLVAALGAPFHLDGHYVVTGASIGIAIAPDDGTDPDQLLKSADLALYRAKAAGRGCFRFFEPGMSEQAQMRRGLQIDLGRALQAGEFLLFYQPKVDIPTLRITGFEALLRWQHPERGLVMPDQFIPLAEETGLIVPLGEWVLRQACAEAAAWPGGQKVAVNLSAAQFGSSALVGAVTSALDQAGLDPARLELEVTETVLIRDTEATLATLHRLKALGLTIALDDFGAGYSSLGYLQKFPFDRVKIDRSFIKTLGHAQVSGAIVQSVLDLCAALRMATTAEGVETMEQCRILAAGGCDEAQGYLFGRPCPATEIPPLLAA
ncbi:MAG: hypothetical protein JWP20_1893 [Roseomonas sp.]|jgi:diguanylate cyclase (GGDEF)-like protein|nr:hypothetical protein [Roseomonas sp.]